MKCLAAELEPERFTTNTIPLKPQNKFQQPAVFILLPPDSGPATWSQGLETHADLGQSLIVPPEITAANLRPDPILWSKACQRAFPIDLTVPWEDTTQEAFE